MLDIRKARKMGLAFLRRARLQAAYRDVFESERGKVVLYDMLERAGVLSVSHVAGDSHTTAFNDGRKSLPLEILDLLRWDPERVVDLANARDKLIDETEAA